jgi:hypothetical protein
MSFIRKKQPSLRSDATHGNAAFKEKISEMRQD